MAERENTNQQNTEQEEITEADVLAHEGEAGGGLDSDANGDLTQTAEEILNDADKIGK